MAHVEFSEAEAERLLALLRERLIAAGFAFVDESAVELFAGADDMRPASSPRERLRRYIEVVADFVASHSEARTATIINEVNAHLTGGALEGVAVRLPEGSPLAGRHDVPLRELLISSESAHEFLQLLNTIHGLVADRHLPDEPGPARPETP